MFFKKGRFVTLQENGNTKIVLLIKGRHHVRGLKKLRVYQMPAKTWTFSAKYKASKELSCNFLCPSDQILSTQKGDTVLLTYNG